MALGGMGFHQSWDLAEGDSESDPPPIKLHRMFINNAFVMSLFEGDLVQQVNFRVAIV